MSDEVENPVEQVAPANNETQPEQAAPADESANAPSVPEEKEELIAGKFKSQDDLVKSYQELEQKATRTAQENAELRRMAEQIQYQAPQQGYTPTEVPELDPDSAIAVDYRIKRGVQEGIRQAKMSEFLGEHGTELLQDPVLDGTFRRRLASLPEGAMPNLNYELAEAKKMLEERTKPQIKEAKVQAEQEATKIAQNRTRMGNVGETASPQKFDEDSLTADEWAKYKGIPRVSGE